MISIAIESWNAFYPECLTLFSEHEEEIGEMNPSMPLDTDVAMCSALDQVGRAIIVVARKEQKMIVYCTFFLSHSLMSKSVLVANQGPFFVTKDERRTGAGLKMYREM